MSFFQLDPQSTLARVRASGQPVHVPTLGQSLVRGSVGFQLVSIAGFMPWALAGKWIFWKPSELLLYSVCAMVFMASSGLLMHRLLLGPETLVRFYKFFSIAFGVYAMAWIAFWLCLKGQHMHLRSAAALLAGTALMGEIFVIAFRAPAERFKISAALFASNALGYFAGGVLEGWLVHQYSTFAKLSWGLCYGLGFGAGLGYAFYAAQRPTREALDISPAHVA